MKMTCQSEHCIKDTCFETMPSRKGLYEIRVPITTPEGQLRGRTSQVSRDKNRPMLGVASGRAACCLSYQYWSLGNRRKRHRWYYYLSRFYWWPRNAARKVRRSRQRTLGKEAHFLRFLTTIVCAFARCFTSLQHMPALRVKPIPKAYPKQTMAQRITRRLLDDF